MMCPALILIFMYIMFVILLWHLTILDEKYKDAKNHIKYLQDKNIKLTHKIMSFNSNSSSNNNDNISQ